MSPAEYARRRARIDAKSFTRTPRWHKRAMKQLNKEAGAVALIAGRKVVGHQLPSGRVVCIKRRFHTEELALAKLAQIAKEPADRHKPIRAFACYSCLGWHLTSQAKIKQDDVA